MLLWERRRAWATGAALAFVGAASFGGSSGAIDATAPKVQRPISQIDQAVNTPADTVQILSALLEVSEDDVRVRLEREPAISALQDLSKKLLGITFAGLWVDQVDGIIHVASATYRPAEFEILRSSFPYPEALTFDVVERSLAELEQLQADAMALNIQGSATIHLATNTVEFQPAQVLVLSDEQVLKETFGSEIDISPTVEYQVSTACTGRFNCAPVLRGGIALDNAANQGYDCTSAFPAHNDAGSQFVITAGHCDNYGGGNQNWTHSDVHFGEMTDSQAYVGHADFAKIKVTNDWGIRGWYFQEVEIHSLQAPSDDFVGQYVCHSGVRTGYECGSISDNSFPPNAGGSLFRKVVGGCALPGDSGGPVVLSHLYNRVAGVQSFVFSTDPSPDSCNDITGWAYAHIGFLDNALNVTVNTR